MAYVSRKSAITERVKGVSECSVRFVHHQLLDALDKGLNPALVADDIS